MTFPAIGLVALAAKGITMSTVATTASATITTAGLVKAATTMRRSNEIAALGKIVRITKETADPDKLDKIVKTVKDVASLAKGAHDTVKAVNGVIKELTPDRKPGKLGPHFYVNANGEKVYENSKPPEEKTYTLTESELTLIIESAKAGSL